MSLPAIREFKLSPSGSRSGIVCDDGGAFVGGISLLSRAKNRDGDLVWRSREAHEISGALSKRYGLPIDASSKVKALSAIAEALNKGDIARAQLITLHMQLPDPPLRPKTTGVSNDGVAKLAAALAASRLLKASWNPDVHPRWPAGAPDSQGGEFAPNAEDTNSSPQTGDASVSPDLSDLTGGFSAGPNSAEISSQNANSNSDVSQNRNLEVGSSLDGAEATSLAPAVAYDSDQGEFEPARYEGEFHDEEVQALAEYLQKRGIVVETELRFEMADRSGRTRIDLLGRAGPVVFGVEVKTGKNPFPTYSQLLVYPHMIYGGSVVSPDRKIAKFGFAPGQLLPPIPVYVMYIREPGAEPISELFDPKKMLDLLKRRLKARRLPGGG